MLFIIDYGLNGLFELRAYGAGTTLNLKIGDYEFKLENFPITITEIPTEILIRKQYPDAISHYEFDGSRLSVLDYKTVCSQLAAFRYYDEDEDRWLFDTKEEKEAYDQFIRSWKAVYTEPESRYEPTQFEIIRKQWIPEKYRPFITSQIVIPTVSRNEQQRVEAICVYSGGFSGMFKKIADELGFTPVLNSSSDTKGKKYHLNESRFTQCNGQYVSKYFGGGNLFCTMTGSFDQCVSAFDRDYNAIYSYLNLVNQEIEGKQIEPLTAKAVYDMILECKQYANAVDSMKSTRDAHKRLLASLVNIENKLKNVR